MNKFIPIGTIIALAISFGALQIQAQRADKDIEKHETKIEKADEKIVENEKIDLRQSIILENITDKLNKLDEKIDLDLKKKPNK